MSNLPDQIRFWDGSAHVEAEYVKYWDGSAMQDGQIRVWDGTDFILVFPVNLPTPQSFSASPAGTDQVDLSWAALPANLPIDSIRIERALDVGGSPGTYSEIVSLSDTSLTSYSNTGLADETTYWYRIRYAVDLEPLFSDYSTADSATTQLTAPSQAPSWASGFPRDKASDESTIELRLNPVLNATSYDVYYRHGLPITNPFLNGTLLGTYTTAQIVSAITEFDTGRSHGDTTHFMCRARNAGGVGPFGVQESVTLVEPAPLAPTAVTITDIGSNNLRATITPASPDYADQYRYEVLQRLVGDSGGSYTNLTGSPTSATSLDFPALEGYEYIVQVRTENLAGNSSYTQSSVFEYCETPVISWGSPRFSGVTETTFEANYTLSGTVDTVYLRYRPQGSSTWSEVTDGDLTSPYEVSSVVAATTYEVQIRATNVCGDDTGWSATQTVTTLTDNVAPQTAPSLSVAPKAATDSVLVCSVGSVVDATNYDLEWAQSVGAPSSGTLIPDIGVSPTYEIGSLSADTSYWVRARAVNSIGDGPWSSWVQAYTHVSAPSVTFAQYEAGCPALAGITWNFDHDNTDGDTRSEAFSYQIRWAQTSGGVPSASWSSTTSVSGGTTSVNTQGSGADSNYYMQIRYRYNSEVMWTESTVRQAFCAI